MGDAVKKGGKSGGGKYLDDLADDLTSKYKDVLKRRNLKIIKQKAARSNVTIVDEIGEIRLIGSKSDIEKYLDIMKLEDAEILRKYDKFLKKP